MIDFIIKYWIQFGFGVITGGIMAIFARLFKRQKAIENGVKALLRDRIIQSCNHYRGKGYCPLYALENIEALFKEYTALGGNGAIGTTVKEMHELPGEELNND